MDSKVLGIGNYFVFIIISIIIVFASIGVSYIIDTIGRRTRFSGALVAGTVVAFISSLPEFTSSLVSVINTHEYDAACGNLMGGNIFRTMLLAVMLIFFIVLMKKAKSSFNQFFLIGAQILAVLLFFFVMFFHEYLYSYEWICAVIDGVIILIYIINLIVLVKKDHNEHNHGDEIHVKEKLNRVRTWLLHTPLSNVFIIFAVCSLVIVGGAFMLSLSTEWMIYEWKMDQAFGNSLLLGIVTTIPEAVTVIALLRIKQIDAAITDILGSNLFSSFIMVFIDLVTWELQNPGGNDPNFDPNKPGWNNMWGHSAEEVTIIVIGFFGTLVFLFGILMTNHIYHVKKLNKNHTYYAIIISMLIMMILSYIYYLLVSFKVIPNIKLPGHGNVEAIINNIPILRRVVNSC